MEELIRVNSRWIKDVAGRDIQILREEQGLKVAAEAGCTLYEVYVQALRMNICPYRYIRNREILSPEEQLKLAQSRVAVVGAGGLGGQVILLLGRVGVGNLVVVDRDVFDETNLNRQALSSRAGLGKSKAGEAGAVLQGINPAVRVTAVQAKLDEINGREILAGSDVVVDALDSVVDRLVLEKVAKAQGIPLVHGALAGFQGQLMTIYPDDAGLARIYGNGSDTEPAMKRPEAILGVPALTASFVANLEAMEVIKILLNRGKPFRNRIAFIDLEGGELSHYTF